MPKPKPDKVVRHEIVLGRSERDMVEGWFSSMTFRNIATPAVNLMNDETGTITFLTLVGTLGLTGVSFAFLASDDLSVAGVIDAFMTQRANAIEALGLSDEGLGGLIQTLLSMVVGLPNPNPWQPPGAPGDRGYEGPSPVPDWTPGTPRPY